MLVPLHILRISEEGKQYILEIDNKQAEVRYVHTVPHMAILDRSLLKYLLLTESLDDVDLEESVEALTSEEIRGYELGLTQYGSQPQDPGCSQEAMSLVRFATNISAPHDQNKIYRADLIERLGSVVCLSFKY